MSGKLVGVMIVAISLIFGAVLYYVQVYHYYDRLEPSQVELTLVNMTTGTPEVIAADSIEAIDGSSSPIRFRACFTAPMSDATMSETYEPYPDPTPLNAPGWFDCFNSVEIGEALEQGRAMAFLGEKEIHDGVDRVIAVFPDGRAYAWNQLNEKYTEEEVEPIR